MLRKSPKAGRRTGAALRLFAAACAIVIAPAAHATGFIETDDFSNDPKHPTLLGTLTADNIIAGMIDTYGAAVGPHGERTNQDMDYVTFTVPTGHELTNFFVNTGTSIAVAPPRNDLLFLGLAAGSSVNVSPAFNSAAGLLGWTLVSQSQLGSDILPAIGAASYPGFPVPGATGFSGPLGAGTYTLWLYDGDNPATYNFKLLTAAVPEPASWALMILGFGAIGFALRRSPISRGPRVNRSQNARAVAIATPERELAASFS